MSPEFTGTLSQHTKDDLEWVLTTPVFPAIESAEDFHKERAAQLIRCAIGDNTVPIDVQSVRGWSMALRQPRQYGTKRVLLAGDAAAAFTAHGGFGLNHGIQDAASLAWRLALLLNRPDGDKQAAALVRSYKSERLQVARWTADRARRLVATSDLVLRATGLEPEGFEKLNALSRSFAVNVLPRATARRIFQFLLRLGMKPLSKLMLSGSAGERARKKVALAIDKQREVFLTTGTDLGWSIKHGFVCPEPRPVPTAVHDHEMYCPTTAPGALIPHLWFDEPVAISTRDLVRGAPLTLLALESESARWHDALRSAAMRWGLAIECPAVGTSKGAHFKVDEGAFARTMQIDASGALLVRGDGIVVWRSRKRCTDPVAELRAALTASFNAKELSESSPNQPLEIA
jgi:2,4-dichlorophenol 6-monooxygenase